MDHATFYRALDQKLQEIITRILKHCDEDNITDHYLQRNQRSEENQKSYAFLLWFLEFYAQKEIYPDKNFITDGNDDYSCDIMINNKSINAIAHPNDASRSRTFVIVQSKWMTEKNSKSSLEVKEINAALQQFDTLRDPTAPVHSKNARFMQGLTALREHIKTNGEVRYLFFTLSKVSDAAREAIQHYIKRNSGENIQVEVIGIEEIKKDFIEVHYKDLPVRRVLDFAQDPEKASITLEIAQANGADSRLLKMQSPRSYVFLVRPHVLHRLFQQYRLSLFAKNIRNPLLESDINQEMVRTAQESPSFFWYYNNGITAISRVLPEKIGKNTTQFEIHGLQIINGAQTVYAIYKAYEEADAAKKREMDDKLLTQIRLVTSISPEIDLNITRYTNRQNPIYERDFRSNDAVQVKLQDLFLQDNIWYERRRGEFRQIPEGTRLLSNRDAAWAYLVFWDSMPLDEVEALRIDGSAEADQKSMIFRSHKDDKFGLYERIFDEIDKDPTKQTAMLLAVQVWEDVKRLVGRMIVALPDTDPAKYESAFLRLFGVTLQSLQKDNPAPENPYTLARLRSDAKARQDTFWRFVLACSIVAIQTTKMVNVIESFLQIQEERSAVMLALSTIIHGAVKNRAALDQLAPPVGGVLLDMAQKPPNDLSFDTIAGRVHETVARILQQIAAQAQILPIPQP